MRLSVIFIFVLFLSTLLNACVMNWVGYNEAYINLENAERSVNLEKIKEVLGEDYFIEENGLVAFNCIDGNECGVVVSEKSILFQFEDVTPIYKMYEMGMDEKEIREETDEYKKMAGEVCENHLFWMDKLNAITLTDYEIDKICSMINIGGQYIDYGHRQLEFDDWILLSSNCVVDKVTHEVRCYRCADGGEGVGVEFPNKTKDLSEEVQSAKERPYEYIAIAILFVIGIIAFLILKTGRY